RIDHDGAGAFPATVVDDLLLIHRVKRLLRRIARLRRLLRHLRIERAARLIGRLLLINGRLLHARALAVTEQHLDEAAAHGAAFGGDRSYRLRGLIRVDRARLIEKDAEEGCAGEEREGKLFEHRRTLYHFVCRSSAWDSALACGQ